MKTSREIIKYFWMNKNEGTIYQNLVKDTAKVVLR